MSKKVLLGDRDIEASWEFGLFVLFQEILVAAVQL